MESRRKVDRRRWDRQHVRALRVHLGLTQQELADRLGTRQQTISEWEQGMYRPRGASSTLLSIVAERARYEYDAGDDDGGEGDGGEDDGQVAGNAAGD